MLTTGGTSWHASNRGVSIFICIYLALFGLVIFFGKQLHDRPKLASILPEAAMIIITGVIGGGIIRLIQGSQEDQELMDGVADSLMSFSPTVFFVILLPPIIFNSGYHLQRDLFFRHITPICLYACLGTVVATIIVACLLYLAQLCGVGFGASFLELLAFGALISATDPVSTLAVFEAKKVDPHLFYLVFGESVINDAVGLVLFESLAHLIEMSQGEDVVEINVSQEIVQFLFDFLFGFIGSMLVGSGIALAYAFFFKYVNLRHTPMLELSLYTSMMYFPFVVAEIVKMSGIVTVLFAGILAQRYVIPTVSPKTAASADTLFRLTAHVTETLIFLELGMSLVSIAGYSYFDFGFIALALIFCLIARACNIYPITHAYNWIVSQTSEKEDDAVGTESKRDYIEMGEMKGAATSGDATDLKPSESSKSERSLIVSSSTQVPMKMAHMLWFVGLRGAVSYALAKTMPGEHHNAFVAATMFIVLFTTFLFGGLTEVALGFLGIETGVDDREYLKQLKLRNNGQGWFARRLQLFDFGRFVLGRAANFDSKDGLTTDESSKVNDPLDQPIEVTEGDYNATVVATSPASIYDFGQ